MPISEYAVFCIDPAVCCCCAVLRTDNLRNRVKMNKFKAVPGGITAPKGYKAAGIQAGIKAPKLDMALIVSDRPAAVAATFTTNRIQGNHVKLCKKLVKAGKAQAIIVNAGNANACNGQQGLKDAVRMSEVTAAELGGISPKLVFPCSTGCIGLPMPMAKIEAGIKLAAAALSTTGGPIAARAIMTTDTVDKQVSIEFKAGGKTIRIGGMAKGAGMIEPNMATMLAFLTTDAAVETGALRKLLPQAVSESFNRITVDGDQSCNDTVLLLANGMAGNQPLNQKHRDWPVFAAAVSYAARELAIKVVKDGEGATRFVTVVVKGAATDADAKKATRAIANSLLVKTAWCGGDPNWGRIIDAVGYSGAMIKEELTEIRFDKLAAVKKGRRAPGVELKDLEKVYAQKSFTVEVNLHLGKGSDTVYTCDCTEEYIKINAEYMT